MTTAGPDAPGRALRAVADTVREEMDHVLHAYVARLRTDPGTPSAQAASTPDVEDHLAAFLADIAGRSTR